MHKLSVFVILEPGVDGADNGGGNDVGADGNHGVDFLRGYHQVAGIRLQQILHGVQNYIFIFGIEINLRVVEAAFNGFIDDSAGVHDSGHADGDDGGMHILGVDFFIVAADTGAGTDAGIGYLDGVADPFDTAGCKSVDNNDGGGFNAFGNAADGIKGGNAGVAQHPGAEQTHRADVLFGFFIKEMKEVSGGLDVRYNLGP